jgi:hypothetical protein
MRRLSKIVGGVLACTLCLFAGHRIVRGDAALQPAERPPGEVDLVQMTTDEAQSADSVAGFSRATSDTVERAKAEIAARSIGLSGTEQDGVVP